MKSDFAKFKKIDAHSHIGKFGSPFDVNFDAAMLREQMAEYSIEKTILCPAAASLNAELLETYRRMPGQVIPLYWVNANLGCGYFSLETAEKVGDAAVIVTGVKNFEEMLAAKVKAVSQAAAALGVTLEMNGRQALLKLV